MWQNGYSQAETTVRHDKATANPRCMSELAVPATMDIAKRIRTGDIVFMYADRGNAMKNGFSLIELMVTIAIAAILAGLAAPAFTDLMASSKASGYANDLLADLNYARNEAITRGVRVTLCHSNDASTCSGSWSDGWIVFANVGESGSAGQDARDNDDEVLRAHGALDTAAGWALYTGNNFANFVAYLPSGRSNNVDTFVFCKDQVIRSGTSTRSSAVSVGRTGRARVLQDTDGDGAPNADDSGNLGNADCS